MYSHAMFWTLLMLTVCSKSVTYVTNDFSVDLGLDNRTTRSEALRFQYSGSTPFFFHSSLLKNISKTYSPLHDGRAQDLPSLCRLFKWGLCHTQSSDQQLNFVCCEKFSRTGDTKKVIHFQLLDCTRDEGTAKQIMMHNFAKDESGSFEKVIWIQSQY